MKPCGLLPCSQELAFSHYLGPHEHNSHPKSVFPLGLFQYYASFRIDFATKLVYAFLTAPCATWPVYCILLVLITPIIFGESITYESPNYVIFSILSSLYPFQVQIFQEATCSQTPAICELLTQWFHTHISNKKNVVLYVLDSRREHKRINCMVASIPRI